MANIIQTFPKGNGGGHTILDSEGTALAQEKNLKITGLSITDNPVDESTDLTPAGLNQDSIDDIAGAGLPGTILVGSGFNYSTIEQIVGRWINSKPIYQKTFDLGSVVTIEAPTSFATTGGTWYKTNIKNTNIDTILKYECLNELAPATFVLLTKSYNGTEYIGLNNGSCRSVSVRYITLCYTKTTD